MILEDKYINIAPYYNKGAVLWSATICDLSSGEEKGMIAHEHITPSDTMDEWNSYDEALEACKKYLGIYYGYLPRNREELNNIKDAEELLLKNGWIHQWDTNHTTFYKEKSEDELTFQISVGWHNRTKDSGDVTLVDTFAGEIQEYTLPLKGTPLTKAKIANNLWETLNENI